jgi:hypothetical protein
MTLPKQSLGEPDPRLTPGRFGPNGVNLASHSPMGYVLWVQGHLG